MVTENSMAIFSVILWASAVQEKYNVSYVCDLKFSSTHILKEYEEMVKFILTIYFTYYIHYIIISACSQYKNLLLRFFKILFLVLSLWNPVCFTAQLSSH